MIEEFSTKAYAIVLKVACLFDYLLFKCVCLWRKCKFVFVFVSVCICMCVCMYTILVCVCLCFRFCVHACESFFVEYVQMYVCCECRCVCLFLDECLSVYRCVFVCFYMCVHCICLCLNVCLWHAFNALLFLSFSHRYFYDFFQDKASKTSAAVLGL